VQLAVQPRWSLCIPPSLVYRRAVISGSDAGLAHRRSSVMSRRSARTRSARRVCLSWHPHARSVRVRVVGIPRGVRRTWLRCALSSVRYVASGTPSAASSSWHTRGRARVRRRGRSCPSSGRTHAPHAQRQRAPAARCRPGGPPATRTGHHHTRACPAGSPAVPKGDNHVLLDRRMSVYLATRRRA
jgi:hypothetical protein